MFKYAQKILRNEEKNIKLKKNWIILHQNNSEKLLFIVSWYSNVLKAMVLKWTLKSIYNSKYANLWNRHTISKVPILIFKYIKIIFETYKVKCFEGQTEGGTEMK